MSEEMKASISKSKIHGESAERTAEEHECTADEVRAIWAEKADYIEEQRAFLKEMGCIE